MLERAIRSGPKLINPLVPEAAELLLAAYRYLEQSWSQNRRLELGAVPLADHRSRYLNWRCELVEWENVQLMICRRPLDRNRLLYGDLVVAVVPGTNQRSDWLGGNLNPLPVRIGGLPGRWRRGFALAGEWVWNRLRLEYQLGDRIAIVGHSYGAAAALVAAACAARDGRAGDLDAVLGFAAPRTTSGQGAQLLDLLYGGLVGQRFILGFDLVPWAVIPLGWHHALEPIFVGSDGRTRGRLPFWLELRSALRRRGLQSIRDHRMSSYAEWARGLPPADVVRLAPRGSK